MKISYFVPNMQEGRRTPPNSLSSDDLVKRAVAAEERGFDGVWIGEYIETPPDVRSGFPGHQAQEFAPLVTMAALAAATSRVRITSGVIVLPYHDPLILGRELATLDNFSGGRITLGVGLGGSLEEYRRTRAVPRAVNRGKLMEEIIGAMRAIWTEPQASFTGPTFAFDRLEVFPKPVQRPLPILMAGTADAVLDRIGRLGEGWIEVGFTPQAIAERIERIRDSREAAGRSRAGLEVARLFAGSIGATAEDAGRLRREAIRYTGEVVRRAGSRAVNGDDYERWFVGTPEFWIERLNAYERAGVTEATVSFFEPALDDALRQMDLFAEGVIPAFR